MPTRLRDFDTVLEYLASLDPELFYRQTRGVRLVNQAAIAEAAGLPPSKMSKLRAGQPLTLPALDKFLELAMRYGVAEATARARLTFSLSELAGTP
jgi:hypothetical protein